MWQLNKCTLCSREQGRCNAIFKDLKDKNLPSDLKDSHLQCFAEWSTWEISAGITAAERWFGACARWCVCGVQTENNTRDMTKCVLHGAGHCCHGDSVTQSSLIQVPCFVCVCVYKHFPAYAVCKCFHIRLQFVCFVKDGGEKTDKISSVLRVISTSHVSLVTVRVFVSRLALPESY